MERAGRRVVLVSGAPGAGKTTLAVPLAAELGFMLLRKDRIKETLHDALAGTAGPLPAPREGRPALDLTWSRQLGGAAMELLWALAADAPAVVLEANFRPYSAYEQGRISALGGCVVEVNCVCPPEVAARRYAARAATTHPVHVLASLSAGQLAEYDRPVGAGGLITVDTTGSADVAQVAAAVRARLAAAGQARVTGSVWRGGTPISADPACRLHDRTVVRYSRHARGPVRLPATAGTRHEDAARGRYEELSVVARSVSAVSR